MKRLSWFVALLALGLVACGISKAKHKAVREQVKRLKRELQEQQGATQRAHAELTGIKEELKVARARAKATPGSTTEGGGSDELKATLKRLRVELEQTKGELELYRSAKPLKSKDRRKLGCEKDEDCAVGCLSTECCRKTCICAEAVNKKFLNSGERKRARKMKRCRKVTCKDKPDCPKMRVHFGARCIVGRCVRVTK